MPRAGQAVVIPAGRSVVLDIDTPSLGKLEIRGSLIFDRRDVTLTAAGIHVTSTGTLAIGSEQNPFTNRATITLTGSPGDSATDRGLMVHDGALLLYGRVASPAWTTLNDHAAAQTTRLTLANDVNWRSGDQIVIAPTDFYGVMQSERIAIASVSGRTINLAAPLLSARWGRLQYVTQNGMSLTPDTTLNLPAEGVPTVLDQRAEVGNLSRNILIQSANDSAWSSGFGAHVMIMGANSRTWIEGVELRRVGQAGRQARYPIHFHLLSYDSAGIERPTGGTRVIRNSTIWDSSNRCITIHGTNDVTLDGNICFDVRGHAIFLEDAVERRNQILNNFVLRVRYPTSANRLLASDQAGDGTGSAGFWLTNPDNTVRGNRAADSQGNGFWLAFPRQPLGENKRVAIRPRNLALREFSDNVAHSNGEFNFQLDWVPYNDAGAVTPLHYEPTSDGREATNSNRVRFTLSRISSWKGEGIWNRPVGANFFEWTSADNLGMFFQGAGYNGRIRRVLAVGESLNNATTWRSRASHKPPTAFASYHSEYNMQDNILVNFPLFPGPERRANGGSQTSHGGMLETKDYYITPVDLGLVQIRNNLLINSHPGFRVAKPDKTGAHWTLAGALWDPNGLWGAAGNYWVYDMPFLTAGTSCRPVAPNGENGQSCVGPYYGMDDFSGNSSELKPGGRFVRTFDVRRLDSSGREIDSWIVRDGRTGDGFFDIMRHAALVKNGRFTLSFSDQVNGREVPYIPRGDLSFHLTNFKRADDEVLIGIPFSGSEQANGYLSSNHVPDLMPATAAQLQQLTLVNSLAEVEAGQGDRLWHDRANNRAWVKVRSPVRRDSTFDPSNVDLQTLHRGTWVRVYSCGFITGRPRNGNDVAPGLCR